MSLALVAIVSVVLLPLVAVVFYSLGHSSGTRDAARRELALGNAWKREREGEPPTSRANLVGMRGGRS